jgi:hypothetical protein
MRSYFLFGVVSAALINHYYYKNEIMKKLGKTYFFLQRAHLGGEDKGWVGIFNFFFRSKKKLARYNIIHYRMRSIFFRNYS